MEAAELTQNNKVIFESLSWAAVCEIYLTMIYLMVRKPIQNVVSPD